MRTRKNLPTYKIVSSGGLFYVFGYVGGGKYMQVSDGLTQGAARDALRRYIGSEQSQRAELQGWGGGFNIND